MKKPVAICVSDLHLQERAPVARSAEPDWWKAMLRPINQLKTLQHKLSVPIVCAGDVFDHWKAPPQLINFALENLPEMYAIPGQHDLPLHAMTDLHKSAFGTLVQVGKIKLLQYGVPRLIKGAYLWGYHWNAELKVPHFEDRDHLHVAVIHAYVWAKGASYPGAKEEQRVGCYRSLLEGFDVAVFGDNHKPFLRQAEGFTVFNHGGFMRRKSDEIDLRPAFGVLYSDGSIQLVHQDVTDDKFIPKEKAKFEEEREFEMHAFLKELNTLGQSDLDFREAVQHYLRTYEVSNGAKRLLLESIHHD